MSVAESSSFMGHLTGAAGSSFRSIGHLGFAATNLVGAACYVATLPFFPHFGTLGTASSLFQTGISTASALKEAGAAVTHTAYAVVNVASSVIPK